VAPRRIRIELDETTARALHAALTAALPDLDGDRLAAARGVHDQRGPGISGPRGRRPQPAAVAERALGARPAKSAQAVTRKRDTSRSSCSAVRASSWAEAAISCVEALVCWVEAETCSADAEDSSATAATSPMPV
jgi:hypothetical protein